MKRTTLLFLDQTGGILAEHSMMALPVREKELIRKSMEYFADPTPCMIHRSAVMQRLYTELIDFLHTHLDGEDGVMFWQEIPQAMRVWIDLTDQAQIDRVKVRQIQKRSGNDKFIDRIR